VTTGFAVVFSLDAADGKEIWSSSVSAPVRGAPLVFGDRVFATSIDNKLHALAAVDGSDLWTFSGLQEVSGYVGGNSPAGSGDLVVAPFTSGELVGLRLENGRTVWNESLVGPRREARAFGNLADIRGRPVIDRGVVLAMGSAGTLAAIDLRSGQRLWERPIGGNQTPWAAGRFVFVVASGADVVCLERDTGKVKWVTPLTQYQDEKRRHPILWGGPVLAGDRLLVGGSTGELLALSPYTGEIIGKLNIGSPIRLAPVVANRVIYVLTDNGRLIALR
jgi:outer membrane protein assembly factor BamB